MNHKNWRNMHWRDMSKRKRIWFVLMCFLLCILLIAIILDCTNIMNIPDWAALIWVVAAGYTAFKNINGNDLWSDADPKGDIDTEEFDE